MKHRRFIIIIRLRNTIVNNTVRKTIRKPIILICHTEICKIIRNDVMAHVKVRKEHNANPHNNTDNHRPHDMLFPLKLRRFPEQDYDSGDHRYRCHDQKHLLHLGEIYVQHGYHILHHQKVNRCKWCDTIAKYHKVCKTADQPDNTDQHDTEYPLS